MIIFYLKSGLRFIRPKKLFSTLNYIGLSVAIAIFLLSGSYVVNELSLGRKIQGSDKIYRVQSENGSTIHYKIYEQLYNIPGIHSATHLMESRSMKQNFVRDNESYSSVKSWRAATTNPEEA